MQSAFGVEHGEISKASFGPFRPGKNAENIIYRAMGVGKRPVSVRGNAQETMVATRKRGFKAAAALRARQGKPGPFDSV